MKKFLPRVKCYHDDRVWDPSKKDEFYFAEEADKRFYEVADIEEPVDVEQKSLTREEMIMKAIANVLPEDMVGGIPKQSAINDQLPFYVKKAEIKSLLGNK